MKKLKMVLALSALVLPVVAQQTNEFGPRGSGIAERRLNDHGEHTYKERKNELSPEKRAELQERRLKLMEKTLEEIGVTEEQRTKIAETQMRHKEAMKAAMLDLNEARRKLSELEKSGAAQEEIFKAIDAVADAQSEQMKILARNRMEMEMILGREKYKEFMDAARNQYRKHGRRSGTGMPPRPDLPPLPGESEKSGTPPTPPASTSIHKLYPPTA